MSLDDYFPQDTAPAVVTEPRKCRRHDWGHRLFPLPQGMFCTRCGSPKDEERARRGKSSRRLGGDQERRIERVYGPTKIGERGDPVDHLGRVWKWQSKATRDLPPKWLAAITEPTWHDPTKAVADAWNRMTGLYGGRRPVVIRSFVRQGVRTRDWLFIDAHDGVDEFGYDTLPYVSGWWVIPGDWWLDHFGRDE